MKRQKKTIQGTLLTLVCIALMLLPLFCVSPVNAQSQDNITINADGTVTPTTAPIQQIGDTYTLINDITGSIAILSSDITFDGNEHSIFETNIGIGGLTVGSNYYSTPPVSTGVANVTVKNLNIRGGVFGISLDSVTNASIFNNTISKIGNGVLSMDEQTAGINVFRGNSNVIKANTLLDNYNGILFIESNNNLIIANTIANCSNPNGFSAVGILFWEASNNTVYHNNLLNNTAQAYDGITIYAAGGSELSSNLWDNGFPSGGNFWSDYQTKYPNATMIDNSGVGDTAYVVDDQNRDNYPLLEPFNATAQVEASPTPSISTPTGSEDNASPADFMVLAAIVVAMALVVAGLVVYYNKRRTTQI